MFHVKLCGADDGVAVRAFTLRVGLQSALTDEVMHQLALIGGHRGEGSRLRASLDSFNGAIHQPLEFFRASVPRPGNIQNESREFACLGVHCETREFL
jgi:hypothetical protein